MNNDKYIDNKDSQKTKPTIKELADILLLNIYNKPSQGLGLKLKVLSIIQETLEYIQQESKYSVTQKDLEEAFKYLAKLEYIRGNGRLADIVSISFKGQVYVENHL